MDIYSFLKNKSNKNASAAPKRSVNKKLAEARNAYYDAWNAKRYPEAFSLLERLGSLGDSTGYAALAIIYFAGKVTEPDFRKAFEYATKAMDAGDGDGAFVAAIMLINKTCMKPDFFRALDAAHLAMDKGIEGAEDIWYEILDNIALAELDKETLSKLLTEADCKKLLDREAILMFEAGNYQKALPMLIRSAEGGDWEAAYLAGRCYFEGLGTDVNLDEAIRWSEAAAEHGDTDAITIAMAGYFGRWAIPDNPDRAGDLKRSADWAHRLLQEPDLTEDEIRNAEFVLLRCRLNEKRNAGVKLIHTDWQEGVKLLEEAADEGDQLSMYCLGLFYGDEDEQKPWIDYSKSAFWYRKAAEAGDTESFLPLAQMLAKTAASPDDCEEALRWAEKAKEEGADTEAVCVDIQAKLSQIKLIANQKI